MTDLSPLKAYKYSSIDKSPISKYLLTPYWNTLTLLFPKWFAPNLITLLGLLFIIGNIITIPLFCPDFIGPAPSWFYYACAAGLFIYQSLDNVDGKQARRTGSSSPLGELFDHGIDSLNCTLGGIVLNACLGFGSTAKGGFMVLVSAWPMYISSWEQFHTGTLYLGFFNGPTEGILIAVGCMLVSAIYGPGIWRQDAGRLFGIESLKGYALETLFLVNVGVALFAVHIPGCLVNVYLAKRKTLARGAALRTTIGLMHQWTPLIVFTGAAFGWLLSPYSSILSDNHLLLFGLFICLIFGRMTTKIILAHLLHQSFPLYAGILIPLLYGTIAVNLPYLGYSALSAETELRMLYILFTITVLIYARWATATINDFTRYLGIKCLSIS